MSAANCPPAKSSAPARPQIIVDADAKETGPRFLGLPERWYTEGPVWRCESGHVSTNYLKSEALGRAACLECRGHLWLTFPEDCEPAAVSNARERGTDNEKS